MYFLEKFDWFAQISGLNNSKTLKKSEIDYFIKLVIEFCHDNSEDDEPYFYDDLYSAIKYEVKEDFNWAAYEYKEVYKSIKNNETSNYKLNEAKKIFEPKISKMLYCEAESYYKIKYYGDASSYFKDAINDEYMTNDIKLECKVKLVYSLYYKGEIDLKEELYTQASENFEEALNIINSDWKVKNKICDWVLAAIKRGLAKCYTKFAERAWSNSYINDMEKSINYLNKAQSFNDNKLIHDALYVYYYLYKAKNEYNYYNKYNYIYQALNYAPKNYDYILRVYRKDYYVIEELYNKSRNIIEFKNQIISKNSNVSNINYELNSIKNNISNTQSIINSKKTLIKNKNDAIKSLNSLIDSLLEKGKEINNQTDATINEEKDNLYTIKKNIQGNKDFVKGIKELEKQKNEDIKNFRTKNKILEQKNQQLMLMLTTLESQLT